MAKDTISAPFGWEVVGEDRRRIGRWLGKSEADALAARVRANTDEKIKVIASDPRVLNLESGLTEEDVRSPEPEAEAEAPVDFDALTVDQLDELAEAWAVEAYPKSGKKDEKVAALTAHST